MIYKLKIAGVPEFWVKTDIDTEDMESFVSYYEAIRIESGYVPLLTHQAKINQRKDFINQMRKQYEVELYARTPLEYTLKQNERSGRWLWRQISKKKEVLYDTVVTWINGSAEPQNENLEILNQIVTDSLRAT